MASALGSMIAALAALCLVGTNARADQEEEDFRVAAEALRARTLEEAEPLFRSAVAQPEAIFVAWWDGLFDAAIAEFAELASAWPEAASIRRERARLLYEWALGRAVYPNFHRQGDGGDPNYDPSKEYWNYTSRVDFGASDLLDLDEYARFLRVHAGAYAEKLQAKDRSLRRGDHQRLRAMLGVTASYSATETRCQTGARILTAYLADYGSGNLSEVIADFARDCAGGAADAVIAAYEEDRALWAGHPVEIYKTIDGTPLEAHILPPTAAASGPSPAVIWFHGGGMNTGAWYWCPACEGFRDAGWTVISVEYRLFLRNGTGPAEALEDAYDAFEFVRRNAGRLNIDAERIVVSGMSAGGLMALSFGAGAEERKILPRAVVSFSGCVSLLNDPLARLRVSSLDALRKVSPLYHVRSRMPPSIFLHGENDAPCPLAAVREYEERARSFGAVVKVEVYEDAGHFFPVADPARRKQAIESSLTFLAREGL